MVGTLRGNLGAITVMLAAVALQVGGAVLLKTIADHRLVWSVALLAGGVGAVIVINLLRLAVWGVAHRRYPLSSTFPLSSLFYPAMLVVAVGFGDQVGALQVVGALLITSGTFWLSSRVRA
jgi:drug/metabolite transporter (DMT)-like permease